MTDVPEDYWEQRARRSDAELRDARQVIAVLLRRLGGEVTVTDTEIVEVEREPVIETFRDGIRPEVVLRVR